MRFLLWILLFFPVITHAKEGSLRLPDTYSCKPDQCNSCTYKLTGIEFFEISRKLVGCTELGCMSSPEIDAQFEKCAQDWRYSKNIHYQELTLMANKCLNGVRNHNYWEPTYNRKDYGQDFAYHQCLEHYLRPFEKPYPERVSNICQDQWHEFMATEEEIYQKHAEQSAVFAYNRCKGYFEQNLAAYGFSKNEYGVLVRYIASRQFPKVEGYHIEGTGAAGSTKTTMVRGQQIRDADILKNIFDFLLQQNRVNHALVVTPQMVEQFMKHYDRLDSASN